LLAKLQEFHRLHHTPIDQVLCDLNEAFVWLPKSAYAAEAKPLAALVRPKRRGPQRIGDLLVPLLIRLGVSGAEVGGDGEKTLESNTSEARSPA
jgi:transposase